MLVCRKRGDYSRKWKISAAFNVSQHDLEPLEIFRETLDCGSLRRAGNGGWYWEVNRLSDIGGRVVPFFERFPLVGQKQCDFELFKSAVALLGKPSVSDADYVDSAAQRTDESWRKKTLLDSENPQRLYADLSVEHGEMR